MEVGAHSRDRPRAAPGEGPGLAAPGRARKRAPAPRPTPPGNREILAAKRSLGVSRRSGALEPLVTTEERRPAHPRAGPAVRPSVSASRPPAGAARLGSRTDRTHPAPAH